MYFTKDVKTCGVANWEKALKAAKAILDRFYIRTTSIFGRATIVNTLIEPKFLYPLHVFDPPKSFFKKYNELIRPFIFKGSTYAIKHEILCLPKELGGVGLHNMKLKHVSFRMKFIKKFLNIYNNPMMSLPNYFFSYQVKNNIIFDNSKPHCFDTLPPFYVTCKTVFNDHVHTILNVNPILFYDTIQKQTAPNVDPDIRNLVLPFTSKHIFPILHNTNKTTPIQKQITYRLIHGITGTTNYKNKFRTKNIHCTICNKSPETEQHLYTSCHSLIPLRLELIRLLRLPHNTLHDRVSMLHRAILLNIYPFNNKAQSDIRNILLAQYRETIWHVRNSTKWDNRLFSSELILNIFKHNLKVHLKKHTTVNEWEQFFGV